MRRNPVVAGQFYPGSKTQWEQQVQAFLAQAQTPARPGRLAMVPHAGYPFSGPLAGQTLGAIDLPETLLLLGPNHTGLGAPLALWAQGAWQIPGAALPIQETLAASILEHCPHIQSDETAHLREHSLEVLLPFLYARQPHTRIVPLAVAESRLSTLLETAGHLHTVLQQEKQPVGLVVSSDMSHFISEARAKAQDDLALQQILELNPEGLYNTVQANKISMCGVLPMTLGLQIAKLAGATQARLVGYTTSAEATGDSSQVVGYAGVIVE